MSACPEDDGDTCPNPAGGTWLPTYELLDGDCGPIDEPFRFLLTGPHSLNALLERRAERSIESQATAEGCDARFSQFVADDAGQLLEQTEVEGLTDRGGSQVRGVATLTRFTAAGEVVCEGRYAATLVREPD